LILRGIGDGGRACELALTHVLDGIRVRECEFALLALKLFAENWVLEAMPEAALVMAGVKHVRTIASTRSTEKLLCDLNGFEANPKKMGSRPYLRLWS
jgi:hypothetical protein